MMGRIRDLLGRLLPGAAATPAAAVPAAATEPAKADGGANVTYDAQTEAIMARVLSPDSTCVDVGCHEGAILDMMLRHAPRGHHYAFEPIPDLYGRLKLKYGGLSNVSVSALALSDKAGEFTFQHVVSNPAYSGLVRRRFDRPHEDVVEIRVQVARLDDVVPRDAPVRFVKIDVEGGELGVLRGAEETLRRCRPYVVFEHGQGSSEMYGTRPEHVHDFLARCGFRVSVMKDWLESGGSKTLSRDAFVQQYEQVINYYFIAHP